MDLLPHGMPTQVSGAHPCLDMTCSLAHLETASGAVFIWNTAQKCSMRCR